MYAAAGTYPNSRLRATLALEFVVIVVVFMLLSTNVKRSYMQEVLILPVGGVASGILFNQWGYPV